MAKGKKEELASVSVIAPKQRRLSDLYVTGVDVVFDDGEGDPIELWIQKLTPAETQEAVTKARPAKSKITAIKRTPLDSEERLIYFDQLDDLGLVEKEDFIEYLINPKLNEFRISAEARIAAEDEWAKDDYLVGLQQAWNDSLEEKFYEDNDDPEASRVYDELKRYTEAVEREVEAEKKELFYELDDLPLEELRRKAMDKIIEDAGDNALIEEFRKQQLYFATRLASDHSQKYFINRAEVDTCPGPVFNKLLLTYIEMSIESFEGKD